MQYGIDLIIMYILGVLTGYIFRMRKEDEIRSDSFCRGIQEEKRINKKPWMRG